MNIIVCGGRSYSDWTTLSAVLDGLRSECEIDRVATGAASGADTLADTWARSRGIPVERYYAQWRAEGKSAGPKRNQRMLEAEKPELVVAFPGGSGTADMVRRAKEAGIDVREIQLKELRKSQ